MTDKNNQQSPDAHRSPAIFPVEQVTELETDTAAWVDTGLPDTTQLDAEPGSPVSLQTNGLEFSKGIRWIRIFFTAVAGLIIMIGGVWLYDLIGSLVSRKDWIGWVALTLITVVGFSLAMIAIREISGLLRVNRVTRLRTLAEESLRQKNRAQALLVLSKLNSILNSPEHRLAKLRMKEHRNNVHDADDLLILAERELIEPLDKTARSLIVASAKRVSIVTAISPAAFVDVLFVTMENLRMLRRLAILYGFRPGTLGTFKLARMIITHIALTGGVAFTTDFVQQLISTKLTAKLSARLGEGIFNGAMTTRIGIAALELCRPLPFIEAQRPRLRDFINAFARSKSPETEQV